MDDDQNGVRTADARTSSRTNMYIAAILCSEDMTSPAKVRNMSSSGALAEAPIIPEIGSVVRLVRGSLSVEGRIAWVNAGRCGIRFSSLVSVGDWMSPPANQAQTRVDETVSLLKAGALPISAARQKQINSQSPIAEELATELRQVSHMLVELGNELTEDDRILQQYGRQLQSLDLAQQTLDLAAAILVHGLNNECDLESRLTSLRASRAQAMARAG